MEETPLKADWMTVREAAEALGVQPSTVRIAKKSGLIRARRLDGRTDAVLRAVVERYRVEHLRRQPPEQPAGVDAPGQDERIDFERPWWR